MIVRRLARPMLASMFLVGGADSVRHPEGKAQVAADVIDPVDEAVQALASGPAELLTRRDYVRFSGAVQVAAGTLLATGRLPRLAATALAATLVPTTLAAHRFWELEGDARRTQRIHFLKNLSMLGGLLLAAADTEGRPGLAWRARRAGHEAAETGHHLAEATAEAVGRAVPA